MMLVAPEYEKAYRDARDVLYLRGKKLGKPSYADGGLRYCPVDGFSLTDRDVLKEAWGDALADELLHDLAECDSLPRSCPDCDRLWQDYDDATNRYVNAFRQSHSAASRHDWAALAQLRRLQDQAAESLLNARKSVRDHATVHIAR
jgi:hypothetical protein